MKEMFVVGKYFGDFSLWQLIQLFGNDLFKMLLLYFMSWTVVFLYIFYFASAFVCGIICVVYKYCFLKSLHD